MPTRLKEIMEPVKFVHEGHLEEMANNLKKVQELLTESCCILSNIENDLTVNDQDSIFKSYEICLEQISDIKQQLNFLLKHNGNDWALKLKENFLSKIEL